MDQNLNEGASASADDTFIADLLAESDAGRQPEPQSQEPEAPRAQSEPQPTREPERIPLAEYLSEREKRQQFERRVQELEAAQKKPEAEAPEIWANPDGWVDHRLRSTITPVQQQLMEDRIFYSQRFAIQEHGKEAVEQAVKSLAEFRQTDPAGFARLEQQASNSRDPVGDVVRWHKQQSTLREIGPDPAAYRAKILEEARNDPEFLASLGLTQAPTSPAQPRADNGQFQPPPKAPARASLPSMRTAGSAAAVTSRPPADQSGDDLLDEVLSGT